MTETKTETKAQPAKRGRKAAADKEAPHGRDEQGKPLAPHGLLPNGKPRITPKRDTSSFDVAFLAAPRAVSEEEAKAAAPTHARDERQKAVDKVVAALHTQWIDAGKPGAWLKVPKAKYPVPPEKASDLRYLVRRAADHLNVRPRWGDPARCNPTKCHVCLTLPENERGGHELVVFGVVDKRTKDDKPKSETPGATPGATPAPVPHPPAAKR
jgi:hypothetical protein